MTELPGNCAPRRGKILFALSRRCPFPYWSTNSKSNIFSFHAKLLDALLLFLPPSSSLHDRMEGHSGAPAKRNERDKKGGGDKTGNRLPPNSHFSENNALGRSVSVQVGLSEKKLGPFLSLQPGKKEQPTHQHEDTCPSRCTFGPGFNCW